MKVTFEDKVGVIPYGTRINQVQDRDLNEIKLAINTNDDIKSSFLNVSTYSDLLLISPEIHLLIIKVLNDENKGIDNTIYYLYPDGTRMWIATVED